MRPFTDPHVLPATVTYISDESHEYLLYSHRVASLFANDSENGRNNRFGSPASRPPLTRHPSPPSSRTRLGNFSTNQSVLETTFDISVGRITPVVHASAAASGCAQLPTGTCLFCNQRLSLQTTLKNIYLLCVKVVRIRLRICI